MQMSTKPFHALCSRMGGSRLRLARKTQEKTQPSSSRGRKVCSRKWQSAKRSEESSTAQCSAMWLARLVSRKPRKMACRARQDRAGQGGKGGKRGG